MHRTHSPRKFMKVKYIVVVQVGLISALLAITGNARASESSDALSQITGAFEFRHPGALNDLAELKRIRQHIEAGEEPWKSNFSKLEASSYARADYEAHPSAVVSLGATEMTAASRFIRSISRSLASGSYQAG